FEAVQINSDNQILRRNRLNLLHRIRAICGQAADLTKLALYGGTGDGRLSLDGRNPTAALAGAFTLSGLQARPFVKDASGYEVIEGSADLAFDLTSSGRSQAQFMNALAGSASFDVADGAIVGVNIAQLARSFGALQESGVAGLVSQASAGAAKTDFAEFGATATIARGVARTDDIRLVGPYVRASGTGEVNLAAQTIDLRLTPQVVASADGQLEQEGPAAADGSATKVEAKTYSAPLRIKGPLDGASVSLDAETAVRDAATKQIGKQLDRLLGGGEDDGEEGADGEEEESAGEQLIRGLFGGRD
ncbi:MAG: AsmA-like C-terminal region-containing protein, partial [Pseudomonadota bacterium]